MADFRQLRNSAVRAIGNSPAQSSPQLRLTLSGNMEADPEFYETWVALRDIRRLIRKDGPLLTLWGCFMSGYDGTCFHEPFSKLIQVCATHRMASC